MLQRQDSLPESRLASCLPKITKPLQQTWLWQSLSQQALVQQVLAARNWRVSNLIKQSMQYIPLLNRLFLYSLLTSNVLGTTAQANVNYLATNPIIVASSTQATQNRKPSPAHPTAQAPQVNNQDYALQEEGWFYYNWELYQDDDTESQQPIPPALTPMVTTPAQLDTTSKVIPTVPATITSAWLKENLPKYLENALDNPSNNNVLAYLYLQAFANQKAAVFAQQAKIVAQGNDYLDSNASFPNLATARVYRDQVAIALRERILQRNARNLELLMVISNDYESRNFAYLVGSKALQLGLKLVLVNLTGQVLPELQLWQQITQPTQVATIVNRLKTQLFPTLYVTSKGKLVVLASGAVNHDELEERLLGHLRRDNLISQQDYNLAKGIFFDPQLQDQQLAGFINNQLGIKQLAQQQLSQLQRTKQPQLQLAPQLQQLPQLQLPIKQQQQLQQRLPLTQRDLVTRYFERQQWQLPRGTLPQLQLTQQRHPAQQLLPALQLEQQQMLQQLHRLRLPEQ